MYFHLFLTLEDMTDGMLVGLVQVAVCVNFLPLLPNFGAKKEEDVFLSFQFLSLFDE